MSHRRYALPIFRILFLLLGSPFLLSSLTFATGEPCRLAMKDLTMAERAAVALIRFTPSEFMLHERVLFPLRLRGLERLARDFEREPNRLRVPESDFASLRVSFRILGRAVRSHLPRMLEAGTSGNEPFAREVGDAMAVLPEEIRREAVSLLLDRALTHSFAGVRRNSAMMLSRLGELALGDRVVLDGINRFANVERLKECLRDESDPAKQKSAAEVLLAFVRNDLDRTYFTQVSGDGSAFSASGELVYPDGMPTVRDSGPFGRVWDASFFHRYFYQGSFSLLRRAPSGRGGDLSRLQIMWQGYRQSRTPERLARLSLVDLEDLARIFQDSLNTPALGDHAAVVLGMMRIDPRLQAFITTPRDVLTRRALDNWLRRSSGVGAGAATSVSPRELMIQRLEAEIAELTGAVTRSSYADDALESLERRIEGLAEIVRGGPATQELARSVSALRHAIFYVRRLRANTASAGEFRQLRGLLVAGASIDGDLRAEHVALADRLAQAAGVRAAPLGAVGFSDGQSAEAAQVVRELGARLVGALRSQTHSDAEAERRGDGTRVRGFEEMLHGAGIRQSQALSLARIVAQLININNRLNPGSASLSPEELGSLPGLRGIIGRIPEELGIPSIASQTGESRSRQRLPEFFGSLGVAIRDRQVLRVFEMVDQLIDIASGSTESSQADSTDIAEQIDHLRDAVYGPSGQGASILPPAPIGDEAGLAARALHPEIVNRWMWALAAHGRSR